MPFFSTQKRCVVEFYVKLSSTCCRRKRRRRQLWHLAKRRRARRANLSLSLSDGVGVLLLLLPLLSIREAKGGGREAEETDEAEDAFKVRDSSDELALVAYAVQSYSTNLGVPTRRRLFLPSRVCDEFVKVIVFSNHSFARERRIFFNRTRAFFSSSSSSSSSFFVVNAKLLSTTFSTTASNQSSSSSSRLFSFFETIDVVISTRTRFTTRSFNCSKNHALVLLSSASSLDDVINGCNRSRSGNDLSVTPFPPRSSSSSFSSSSSSCDSMILLLARVFVVVVKANFADDAKSNIARESSFGAFRRTDFRREENTSSSSSSSFSSSMFAFSTFQRLLVRPCLRLVCVFRLSLQMKQVRRFRV